MTTFNAINKHFRSFQEQNTQMHKSFLNYFICANSNYHENEQRTLQSDGIMFEHLDAARVRTNGIVPEIETKRTHTRTRSRTLSTDDASWNVKQLKVSPGYMHIRRVKCSKWCHHLVRARLINGLELWIFRQNNATNPK